MCECIFLIGEGKPSLQMVGHVNPAIHPTCYFSDLLGEVTHSLSIPVCPQSSTVVSSDVLRTAAKCCPGDHQGSTVLTGWSTTVPSAGENFYPDKPLVVSSSKIAWLSPAEFFLKLHTQK